MAAARHAAQGFIQGRTAEEADLVGQFDAQHIAGHVFDFEGTRIPVTVSLGVAGSPHPDIKTAEDLVAALGSSTYKGVAMTYKSDGEGDMAHDADIVCWDGTSRIPNIVKHYAGEELVLK